jgi:hypothetical protein
VNRLDRRRTLSTRLALRWTLSLSLLAAFTGCLGQNRKVTATEDNSKKTHSELEPVHEPAPRFLYREIATPPTFDTTVELSVSKDGRLTLAHGAMRLLDTLRPEERSELDSLAQRVSWDRLPSEFTPRATATIPPDARTYEVTFGGVDPARAVTMHDGVDYEDEAFGQLRKRLREISRRVESRN